MKSTFSNRLDEVNWNLPDSAIARAFDCQQGTVLYYRKKLRIPKSTINPRASAVEPFVNQIDWQESDTTIARKFGLDCYHVEYFRKSRNKPKATMPTIRKERKDKRTKEYHAARNKAHRVQNKNRLACAQKEYRQTHKVELKLKQKAHYEANKETVLKKQKEYYERNKPRILARNKAYMQSKPIEYRRRLSRESAKRIYRKHGGHKWVKENPERRREIARNYSRRLLTTAKGRLNHRMSTAIRCALQMAKAGRAWESLVGYTIDDLRRHIESKFKPGMNWDRLMAGHIEIDHIIPKAKFHYESPEDPEFKRCWALENLQPLWTRKNREKHAQILEPSQIPLGI